MDNNKENHLWNKGFSLLWQGHLVSTLGDAAYNNKLSVWMLFLAAISLSICGALFRPGVNSTVPDLVPTRKLTNANSLLSMASTGSNMLGNIAGGYLFQSLGANLLFLFNIIRLKKIVSIFNS